jgi:hypothetical protein
METVLSSETSVNFYTDTQDHTLEGNSVRNIYYFKLI